jgi:hypothetical protein
VEEEMSELGPEARALLDAARQAYEPTLADRARVRAALDTRMATLSAGGAAPSAAPKTWTVGQVAVGALGAGALALLAFGLVTKPWLSRGAISAGPAPVQIAPQVPAEPPALAPPEFAAAPALRVDEVPTVSVESLPGALPPKPALRALPPKPAPPSVSPADGSLEAEVALVREAQAALAVGDAAKALSALDEHARRFPAGVMTEERQATRVLALCAAGLTADARAAGKAFLDAHPSSPAAQRVRSSCGGAP